MMTNCTIERHGSLVSNEHVNDLVCNYKLERWKTNSLKLGKPDSLSTWFGIEQLEFFLNLSKEHGADGIKMFFGVYPSDYPNVELAGRQTIVMVATRKAENHPGARNKALFINQNGRKQLLAFNKGESCPPFCGGIPPEFDTDPGIELDPIGFTLFDGNDGIEIF